MDRAFRGLVPRCIAQLAIARFRRNLLLRSWLFARSKCFRLSLGLRGSLKGRFTFMSIPEAFALTFATETFSFAFAATLAAFTTTFAAFVYFRRVVLSTLPTIPRRIGFIVLVISTFATALVATAATLTATTESTTATPEAAALTATSPPTFTIIISLINGGFFVYVSLVITVHIVIIIFILHSFFVIARFP